ncbi:Phosphatase 2C family protein [Hibiscus syriacus]|uniref:Phosphatase 2C family protein n=1 Tax=Hibiscus syriacus TaxID=106335 RepID=A0A6A2XIR5_HIBSY|nr:wall-associated receptor kinase-like 20 [Hibiscus syriacus]KAE8675422.1 Phosphatase 2C family protein [Hibiscus syriacus]
MVHAMVFLFILVTQVSAYRLCPKCSKTKVPYPLSTDENCGDPRYRIYCNEDVLEFMSAQGSFHKILSVDPKANKLVIKPPSIDLDTCYSSDLDQGGLSLDESLPFNISKSNTVMLFNCSDNILLSPLNCSSSSFCREFEESGEGCGCRGTLCCHFLKDSSMTSHRIRVRVGGCTAYTCVVDKQADDDSIESWNFGIELQWLPPF